MPVALNKGKVSSNMPADKVTCFLGEGELQQPMHMATPTSQVATPCLTLSSRLVTGSGENSSHSDNNQRYAVPPEMPSRPLKQQRSSHGLLLPGVIPQQASKNNCNRTFSATANEESSFSCVSSEASNYRKTSASDSVPHKVHDVVTQINTVKEMSSLSFSSPNMHHSATLRPFPSAASPNVRTVKVEDANAQQYYSPSSITTAHSGNSFVAPSSSPNMHPSSNLRPFPSDASSNVRPVKLEDANAQHYRLPSSIATVQTGNPIVAPLSNPDSLQPFVRAPSPNVRPVEVEDVKKQQCRLSSSVTTLRTRDSVCMPLSSLKLFPPVDLRTSPDMTSSNVRRAVTTAQTMYPIVMPFSSPSMHPSGNLRPSLSVVYSNVRPAITTAHTGNSIVVPLSSPNMHPSGNLPPSHSMASSNVRPVEVVNAQQSRLPQSGNSVTVNTVPPQTPPASLQRFYPLVAIPFISPSGWQQPSIQCVSVAPQPTPVYPLVQRLHFATVRGSSMSNSVDIPEPSAQSVSSSLNQNRAAPVNTDAAPLRNSHKEILPKPWTQFPQGGSSSERKKQLDQACDQLTRFLDVVTRLSKIRGDFGFLVQYYRRTCELDPSSAIIIDSVEALIHFLNIAECKLKEESHALQNSCQSLQSLIKNYQKNIRTDGNNYQKLLDTRLCTEKNIDSINEDKAAEIKRDCDEMKTELSELRVKMAELRKEKDELYEKWLKLADI